MEKDMPKSHCAFSLKRLLEIEPKISNKKRKTPISLSKSRNQSNSSSQQSQLDIKPEPLFDDSPLNIIKNDDCEPKTEQVKTDESIYFEKEKLEAKNEQLLCNIKDEPEINEIIPLEMNMDAQGSINNPHNSSYNEQKLEEYACPICNEDITNIKSSYFRQKHVEDCILIENKPQEDEELEFDDCVFCGKNLIHFNSKRRQIHINTCLDVADDLKKQHQESMFAGQHVPFLSTLDLCPVCHEFGPFESRALKQKIIHIKQCAKKNQLSVPQLLKKFQWIGWGHVPMPTVVSTIPGNLPSPSPLPSLPQKTLEHQLVAYTHDNDMLDDDFSRKVIIHASRVPETNQRQDDKLDEELQTALAISKSLKQTKRKQHITRLDERDWNAANIWSSEDSKLNAMTKLDEILFPKSELDIYRQAQREKSNGQLRPSCIPSHTHFFWDLTNNSQSNWHEPLIFTALFIQDLYNHKNA
ncbi:hypothetical protein INT46_007980 [Mucor plumbeus]|uniref:Uncharacterized protein n=1 Tax=Mucor plumbeus TaxID=97098 RepID=A0A8H7RIJ8_9FUNG|nr:hypothetical protein INT46_007980 [Mucor plumbeus]